MPFHPSYRYHTRRLFLVWLLASLALTGGCGGSSSTPASKPTPAPTTTRARVTILWEERNRAIIAPIAALSAHITLARGSLDRQDISFVVNRRDGGESYREAYLAPTESPIGEVEARIHFYAERDAQGIVIATAAARVPLGVDGHISEIVTQGVISTLQILPGKALRLGNQNTWSILPQRGMAVFLLSRHNLSISTSFPAGMS
jgi:hypothetical protein